MSDVQKALCLLMLVLFPPVSEELLYRHFVIGVFPLHHRTWQWVAVLFTGGLFVVAHSQYDHWPTILLIAVLGVMFAIARVRTGGILVPVAMHCAAEVIGMSTDWALGKLL
nr:CPBP family intramembrane glutamic endopeptidase [Pseudomonas syringae]